MHVNVAEWRSVVSLGASRARHKVEDNARFTASVQDTCARCLRCVDEDERGRMIVGQQDSMSLTCIGTRKKELSPGGVMW